MRTATRTRIKICCISSKEEAELAIQAGAMSSGPGVIEDDAIQAIARDLPAAISAFLLTQECSADAIMDHVSRCQITTVQIVNHIAPRELQRLCEGMPALRIAQVIHVEGSEAFRLLGEYEEFAHSFLLDSGSPTASIPLLGGTGHIHDWSLSAEFVRRSRRPVFLAGGLSPGNVAEAIRVVRPYGLDTCSGVRTARRLDGAKLGSYFAAIKAKEAEFHAGTIGHADERGASSG